MESSPLKDLPPEIRLYIYELAMAEPYPVSVTSIPTFNDEGRRISKLTYSPRCALPETCRQIRMECSTSFFKANAFLIRLNDALWKHLELPTINTNPEERMPAIRENWQQQIKPLVRFTDVVKKMEPSKLRVQIHIGAFTLQRLWHRILLLVQVRALESYLSSQGRLFKGECLINFSVLLPDPSDGTEEITCTVNCKHPVRSLCRISQFFEERVHEIGVEAAIMSWASTFFGKTAEFVEREIRKRAGVDEISE